MDRRDCVGSYIHVLLPNVRCPVHSHLILFTLLWPGYENFSEKSRLLGWKELVLSDSTQLFQSLVQPTGLLSYVRSSWLDGSSADLSSLVVFGE